MALTKASFSMITGAPANILDYGADPTGVADSTAAIQAALDASDAVYVPTGTFLVTGAGLTVSRKGVALFGNSRSASIINYTGTGTCLSAIMPINELQQGRFYLRDLEFQASGPAENVATGVFIKWTHNSTWVSVSWRRFGNAVVPNTVYMLQIFGFYCLGWGGANVTFLKGNLGKSRHWTIKGGNVNAATLDLTLFDNCVFEDIDFEPTSGTLKLGDENTLLRCRFEQFPNNPPLYWAGYRTDPWITLGNQSFIQQCTFAFEAAPLTALVPGQYLVKFEGFNSWVDMGSYMFDGTRTVQFSGTAFNNTVVIRYPADQFFNTGNNPNYKVAFDQVVNSSGGENYIRWIYQKDVLEVYQQDGVFATGKGYFENLLTRTSDLPTNAGVWDWTGASRAASPTFPVGYVNSAYYVKLVGTLIATTYQYYWTGTYTIVDAGYYTFSFAYKSFGDLTAFFQVNGSLPNPAWQDFTRAGQWKRANLTMKLNPGDVVSFPQVQLSSPTNVATEFLELGELSFNIGYSQPFVATAATAAGVRI